MRKATRTDDIEEVPLITDGITPPPDPTPVHQPRAIAHKPNGGTRPPDPSRRFRLFNNKTDTYLKNDKGDDILFDSKSAAKRVRNRLNNKHGSGYFYVVQVPKVPEPSQQEFDVEESFEDQLWNNGWGGWGC